MTRSSDLDVRLADALRRRLPHLPDAQIGAVLMVLTQAFDDARPGMIEDRVLDAMGTLAALQVTGSRLYCDATTLEQPPAAGQGRMSARAIPRDASHWPNAARAADRQEMLTL